MPVYLLMSCTFSSVGSGMAKYPEGSYHKLQLAHLPLVLNVECSAKVASLPVARTLNITLKWFVPEIWTPVIYKVVAMVTVADYSAART